MKASKNGDWLEVTYQAARLLRRIFFFRPFEAVNPNSTIKSKTEEEPSFRSKLELGNLEHPDEDVIIIPA